MSTDGIAPELRALAVRLRELSEKTTGPRYDHGATLKETAAWLADMASRAESVNRCLTVVRQTMEGVVSRTGDVDWVTAKTIIGDLSALEWRMGDGPIGGRR